MIENDFLRKFEASEKIKSLMQYPLNFFFFFFFYPLNKNDSYK